MAQLKITWGFIQGSQFIASTVFPEIDSVEFGETLTPIARAPLSGPVQDLHARLTSIEGAAYAGIGTFAQEAINYVGPSSPLYVKVQRGDYLRAIETDPVNVPVEPGAGLPPYNLPEDLSKALVLGASGPGWAAQSGGGGGDSMLYNVAVYIQGQLEANEVILRYLFTDSVDFPDATVSRALAATAATAETVITLARNGSSFATVTFGAGSAVGAILQPGLVAFDSGDIMSFTATNADATLADISITLTGVRT